MTNKDQIRAFLDKPLSERGFEEARTLYNQFGAKPHLKRKIKAGLRQPYFIRLISNHLKSELPAMAELQINPESNKPESKVAVIRVYQPEEVGNVYELKVEGNDRILGDDEKGDLEQANARLYSQRCMLSNQLHYPVESEAQRLTNAKLIGEIEDIHAQLLKNRNLIRKGKQEIEVDPKTQGKEPIVVYMGNTHYTLTDLKEMSDAELAVLREKLRQMHAKAEKRINSSKTPSARQRNKEKVVEKKIELDLVDRIRKDRRDG